MIKYNIVQMKVAAYVKSDAPKFPRSCFALEIDSATVLLDFSVSSFFTSLFFLLFTSPSFSLCSCFLFTSRQDSNSKTAM